MPDTRMQVTLGREQHLRAAAKAARLGVSLAEYIRRLVAADLDPVDGADGAIGRRYADQSFSLVDRTSFAVLERLGIVRVAAFGNDFAVYRFGPDDRNAFTLVR